MKTINKTLLFIAVFGLSGTSAFARDYGHNSGISIHLGSHHNGLHLNYSAPTRHHNYQSNHRYNTRSSYPPRSYYKHQKRSQLGYFSKKAKKHYRHRNDHYQPSRYSHRNNYYQQPRYSKRHHYSSYNNDKYSNRHYRQNHQACHPVSKLKTNRYGRTTNIGGTMCYNKYGQGYIVKGSRHALH